MSFQNWLFFVAFAILPAMSPGPAILNAVSNALRFGPRSVFYSALGNSLGMTILGFAVAFGLAAVMEASAAAFTIVKAVGAVYLIYLGIKLWRTGGALALDSAPAQEKSKRALFTEALVLSITNPKALVLLAVLLPPFVDHTQPVPIQVAILSITFAIMCFANHIFLAFAGAKARAVLTSPRRLRNVQRVLGGLFVAFGASLALAAR